MADPANLTELLTNPWPRAGSPGPAQATLAALLGETARHISALPTDYSSYVGEPLVVAADGSGPKPISTSGVGAMDFGGVGVFGIPLTAVTITGSGLVTWDAHLARTLVYAGAGGITLTINLDGTGQRGVKDAFECLIVRAFDGGSVGAVTIALGAGLTSQRSDAKVGVAAGGRVGVQVIGSRVFLSGSLV